MRRQSKWRGLAAISSRSWVPISLAQKCGSFRGDLTGRGRAAIRPSFLLEVIFAADAVLVRICPQSFIVEAFQQIGHNSQRRLLPLGREGAFQLFQQAAEEMLPRDGQGL